MVLHPRTPQELTMATETNNEAIATEVIHGDREQESLAVLVVLANHIMKGGEAVNELVREFPTNGFLTFLQEAQPHLAQAAEDGQAILTKTTSLVKTQPVSFTDHVAATLITLRRPFTSRAKQITNLTSDGTTSESFALPSQQLADRTMELDMAKMIIADLQRQVDNQINMGDPKDIVTQAGKMRMVALSSEEGS